MRSGPTARNNGVRKDRASPRLTGAAKPDQQGLGALWRQRMKDKSTPRRAHSRATVVMYQRGISHALSSAGLTGKDANDTETEIAGQEILLL
ncbi:MAG: hypothetical protein Q7S46_07480 [Gallionella sp.]|nr:hypothetical protein [Gallionella sp.]